MSQSQYFDCLVLSYKHLILLLKPNMKIIRILSNNQVIKEQMQEVVQQSTISTKNNREEEEQKKQKLDPRFLTRITSLNLSFNANNWSRVMTLGQWSTIYSIDISTCCVIPEFCQINQSKFAEFKLFCQAYTNKSVSSTINKPIASTLKYLNLDGNSIGRGLKNLIGMCIPQLTYLSLNSCNLLDSGYRTLSKHYFPKLQQLHVDSNNVSTTGHLQIQKAISKSMQIIYLSSQSSSRTSVYWMSLPKKYITNIHEPIFMMHWIPTYSPYPYQDDNSDSKENDKQIEIEQDEEQSQAGHKKVENTFKIHFYFEPRKEGNRLVMKNQFMCNIVHKLFADVL